MNSIQKLVWSHNMNIFKKPLVLRAKLKQNQQKRLKNKFFYNFLSFIFLEVLILERIFHRLKLLHVGHYKNEKLIFPSNYYIY